MFFSGAEAAGENSEARDGTCRGIVPGYRRDFGRRALRVPGRVARRPRRVLVHGQGVRLPLLLFVVSVYVSAVPVRSVDASWVAIFDPAGAG